MYRYSIMLANKTFWTKTMFNSNNNITIELLAVKNCARYQIFSLNRVVLDINCVSDSRQVGMHLTSEHNYTDLGDE